MARISITVRLCCTGLADSGIMPPMKYREVIADKLHASGWSWGYCSGMVGDVGVHVPRNYPTKADCNGPQFREISINL